MFNEEHTDRLLHANHRLTQTLLKIEHTLSRIEELRKKSPEDHNLHLELDRIQEILEVYKRKARKRKEDLAKIE